MQFECAAGARFSFGGPMGERIQANVDNWLLQAPVANPGMLEMFRLRDRRPEPQLVPWAGEFIGKYLISAIQALRMTDDPRLRPFIAQTVSELIATQAEDGYLGPFRRQERLLGHWDLWGHYHSLLALVMWHEDTGDQASLDCAVRVGDLICNTFLDTGRKVHDAGSQEMNMAVIHGLGRLYEHAPQARYLRMMEQIVGEWELPPAGDYLRTGLAGLDFYRTPKPRWESLHDLQGLVSMYEILSAQGNAAAADPYRRAFEQHWTSIRNHDRHPDGGFTTGEQAIGSPYGLGAIETCCTISWMALSVDMLRLTGDPAVADELELATWNGMLGAQHPSGRWWTYDTPLDGARQASAHTIVFQSREGTPELNCCSVNAPRGLGMLSEWAVMADAEGLAINYYGPLQADAPLPDGSRLRLTQETVYPANGLVRIVMEPAAPVELTLKLRIPSWTAEAQVRVNEEPLGAATPGSYLTLRRTWQQGDVVELSLDMTAHHWAGELGRSGMACVYYGPLLLAFDQKHNALDTPDVPPLDLSSLELSPVRADARFAPLVLFETRAQDGTPIRLCDFASAGAHGTRYRSWLPAVNGLPAPFHLKRPGQGAKVGPGEAFFAWTGYRAQSVSGRTFTSEIAQDAGFATPLLRVSGLQSPDAVVTMPGGLRDGAEYLWRVSAVNAVGVRANCLGPRRFIFDAAVRNEIPERARPMALGPRSLVVSADLDGTGEPRFGTLARAVDVVPAEDRKGNPSGALAFNGQTSRVEYEVTEFPTESYTVSAWVCPEGLPTDRLHQIFSAWAGVMDDPLRVVLDGPTVHARIEAGGGYGTGGAELANGRWTHVAAVKDADRLCLYIDGELRHAATAPAQVFSQATKAAIGANPNYGGNECLLGRLDEFRFYAEALPAEDIRRLYEAGEL